MRFRVRTEESACSICRYAHMEEQLLRITFQSFFTKLYHDNVNDYNFVCTSPLLLSRWNNRATSIGAISNRNFN